MRSDRQLGVGISAWAGAHRSTSRRFRRIRIRRSRGSMAATRRARDRRWPRTGSRCQRRGSPPGTKTCWEVTSTSFRSRRPIICTPIRRSPPPSAGKHIVLEKPTGLDVEELVADSRRRSSRRRPHHRLVRAALQPVSQSGEMAARGRAAGTDPVCAHAVPVARHRLVQRMGMGAAPAPAAAATCSRRDVTPSTRCGGARASSRWRSPRFTRTSPQATSGRPRLW